MTAGGETIHATCVAIDGRGVLLIGPPGAGKSDLALRLIDRGAVLVADDRTQLRRDGHAVIAACPATIAGRIEVRGVGIVDRPHTEAPVALAIRLDEAAERMPPDPLPLTMIGGHPLPTLALAALEASAPIKVELALRRLPR